MIASGAGMARSAKPVGRPPGSPVELARDESTCEETVALHGGDDRHDLFFLQIGQDVAFPSQDAQRAGDRQRSVSTIVAERPKLVGEEPLVIGLL